MRRLFLYLIVATLVFAAFRAMHARRERPDRALPQWGLARRHHDDAVRRQRELVAEAQRHAKEVAAEAKRAMAEAKHDVHQTWLELRDELNRAYREARDELRQAYRELMAEHQRRQQHVLPPPPAPAAAALEREEADGLPVPIVPGTRVTEAEARPPVPARAASLAAPRAPSAPACQAAPAAAAATTAPAAAATEQVEEVRGEICANEERAEAEGQRALQARVAKWLEPQHVPASWTPPAGLLNSLVINRRIEPHISDVDRDDGPMYVPVLTVDLSPERRAELVDTYTRDLVRHRLLTLGGSLGFVLICLAAISGYIRADEATKGYYTNRLRLLAAAGVGAAGVIVYRMIA
jgi:hypothetical protein